MSLKRPEQKMSKSDPDPKSRVLITDSPEEIHAKIRGAVTDSEPGISFDPKRRPGVSNLVEILKHVTESRERSEYIAKDNANVSMRAFKEMIADEIIAELRGVRERFLDLMTARHGYRLRDEVEKGGAKARRKARLTMGDVAQALGLTNLVLTPEEAARIQERRLARDRRELGADLHMEFNPFQRDPLQRDPFQKDPFQRDPSQRDAQDIEDELDDDDEADEEWAEGKTRESVGRHTG
jgi:hypothetical protein